MAIYNLSNLTDAQNIVQITNAVNQLSGDVFGIMFLVTVFVITFTVSQVRGDFAMSGATASYVTSIMGFFAVGVGFVAIQYAFIPIVLVALGTAMLFAMRE